MATCGVPSGSPSLAIGWQITSRHPSKLGCLRVAVRFPSTRASNISENGVLESWSFGVLSHNTPTLHDSITPMDLTVHGLIDSQVIHHHAPSHPAKGLVVGHALTSRRRHRIAQITFTAHAHPGQRT